MAERGGGLLSFGGAQPQKEDISDLMTWRRDSRAQPFNGCSIVAPGETLT